MASSCLFSGLTRLLLHITCIFGSQKVKIPFYYFSIFFIHLENEKFEYNSIPSVQNINSTIISAPSPTVLSPTSKNRTEQYQTHMKKRKSLERKHKFIFMSQIAT